MAIEPTLITDDAVICGYFGDRPAQHIYISPDKKDRRYIERANEYRAYKFGLLAKGFLAESFAVASNNCPSCNLCVPLRMNIAEFAPSNSQKKLTKSTERLTESIVTKPVSVPVLYELFKKYLNKRHPLSPMHDFTEDSFNGLLYSKNVMILLVKGDDLIGYALIDRHENSASLEHIFYDPEFKKKNLSLGKYLWLKSIEWARNEDIEYLYLGPYNASPKLSYKAGFSGLEVFADDIWQKLNKDRSYEGPNWQAMVEAEGFNLHP